MKTITLSRKEFYEKVWHAPIAEICNHFDVPEEGFEEICRKLDVPIPDTAHWRKVHQGKKSNSMAIGGATIVYPGSHKLGVYRQGFPIGTSQNK